MSTHPHWQRAHLLFEQRRYDMAADELRLVLGSDPDDAAAHALLALCLLQLDDLDDAEREAQAAIAADPELPFAYRALAAVRMQKEDHEAAAAAIDEAIRLDPDDVDHRGLLAQIRLAQRRWQAALDACNAGLELDPHDTDCLNLRAIALSRLGRGAEAVDTVDASLAHDPDNPYTHQARAFALLQRGDSKGAVHHFQEALRRDPSLESSRHGLLEALKARNPLYRLVLGWFLWLDRFPPARQLQIMVGIFLVARFGGDALEGAGYETAAAIVSYSWLLFVFVTTCSVPIFNLLLLLHPLGRHALDRGSRNDALTLGAVLVVAIAVGAHAGFGESAWSAVGWPFWCVLLLPVAGIGLFHRGFGRYTLQAFCVLIVVAWVWWAFALEARIGEIRVDQAVPARGSLHAKVPKDDAEIDWLFQVSNWLLRAAALSTWFVLLAPKGRARRGRRG